MTAPPASAPGTIEAGGASASGSPNSSASGSLCNGSDGAATRRTIYFSLEEGDACLSGCRLEAVPVAPPDGARAASRGPGGCGSQEEDTGVSGECTDATEEEEGSTAAADDDAWALERRELELTKVNLQETKRRQQEVEQSVSSLLRRLEELPSGDLVLDEDSGVAAVPETVGAEVTTGQCPGALVTPPAAAVAAETSCGQGGTPPSPPAVLVAASRTKAVDLNNDGGDVSFTPLLTRVGSNASSASAAAPSNGAGAGASYGAEGDGSAGGGSVGQCQSPPQFESAVAGLALAGINVRPWSSGSPDPTEKMSPLTSPSCGRTRSEPRSEPTTPSIGGEREETDCTGAMATRTLCSSSSALPPFTPRLGEAEGDDESDNQCPELPRRSGGAPVDEIDSATPHPEEPEQVVAQSPKDLGGGSASAATATAHVAIVAAAAADTATAGPPLEPELPVQLGESPADQSLLPPVDASASSREGSGAGSAAASDLWRGWTIETSRDGSLFYHHSATQTSQWRMPRELAPVLGEWAQVAADGGKDGERGGEGSKYWRNDLLGVSSWRDPRYTTSLFQAALDGNLFFLQLYTEVGGFLDAADAKGRTALHYNCAGGGTQAVLYMLQNRASVDTPDQGGSTPLHWACRYGHAPIVRILLEAKSDPDRQNVLGDTSMHEAAALGRVSPLQYLVLARGDPAVRNRESKTPAEVAARNNATDAAKLLQEQESYRHHPSLGPLTPSPSVNRGAVGGAVVGAAAAAVAADRRRTRGGGGGPAEEAPSTTEDDGELRPVVLRRARTAPAIVEGAHAGHGSDSESGNEVDEAEPSLALVIVRAARPVLRGVQWLANRLLGERKADLGANNRYEYDTQSQQWVLRRPVEPRRGSAAVAADAPSDFEDADDSGSSVGSVEEIDGAPTTPARRPPARSARPGFPSHDSDGTPGP